MSPALTFMKVSDPRPLSSCRSPSAPVDQIMCRITLFVFCRLLLVCRCLSVSIPQLAPCSVSSPCLAFRNILNSDVRPAIISFASIPVESGLLPIVACAVVSVANTCRPDCSFVSRPLSTGCHLPLSTDSIVAGARLGSVSSSMRHQDIRSLNHRYSTNHVVAAKADIRHRTAINRIAPSVGTQIGGQAVERHLRSRRPSRLISGSLLHRLVSFAAPPPDAVGCSAPQSRSPIATVNAVVRHTGVEITSSPDAKDGVTVHSPSGNGVIAVTCRQQQITGRLPDPYPRGRPPNTRSGRGRVHWCRSHRPPCAVHRIRA